MFATPSHPHSQQPVFQRGLVACAKCSRPIAVNRPNTIVDEFTVTCGKCHHRGFYSKRVIEIKVLPERRKKARR